MVGVILLFFTFFLSFTGYLLPWDQLSIWAVTVGTNMAGATPFIGDQTRFLLIGGYDLGDNALIRWYTLHVIALPLVRRDPHGRALLAHPQGRRHLWTALMADPLDRTPDMEGLSPSERAAIYKQRAAAARHRSGAQRPR